MQDTQDIFPFPVTLFRYIKITLNKICCIFAKNGIYLILIPNIKFSFLTFAVCIKRCIKSPFIIIHFSINKIQVCLIASRYIFFLC